MTESDITNDKALPALTIPTFKCKAFEAAKALRMSADAFLGLLKELGFSVKNRMSTVTDEHIKAVCTRMEVDKQALRGGNAKHVVAPTDIVETIISRIARRSPAVPTPVAGNNGVSTARTTASIIKQAAGTGSSAAKGERLQKEEHVTRGDQIKNICLEKNITTLVHFTQVCNLSSILRYGILPRGTVDSNPQKYNAKVNDNERYDGHLNASCVCIEHPNYKMFNTLRLSCGDKDKWVVLLLDSSVLWELDCAFCISNAAKNISRINSLDERKKPEALESMFSCPFIQSVDGKQRANLNLPDRYPTDPQAEVLVFSTINDKYIKAVHFTSQTALDNWLVGEKYTPTVTLAVNQKYFGPRSDWPHWKNDTGTGVNRMLKDTEIDDDLPF